MSGVGGQRPAHLADGTAAVVLLGQAESAIGAVVMAAPGHHRIVALLPLPPAAARITPRPVTRVCSSAAAIATNSQMSASPLRTECPDHTDVHVHMHDSRICVLFACPE